jgi:hypothetical protein
VSAYVSVLELFWLSYAASCLLHSLAPFLDSLACIGCLLHSSALLGSCLTRTGCLMCSLALLCGLARADCLLRSSALLSSCLACAGCLLCGSVLLCGLVCTGSLHAAEVDRGMMCVGTCKLLHEFLSTLCCDHPLHGLVSSSAKVGTGISHSAACGGDVGRPGPLWASPLSLSASQALPLHTLTHMCSGLSRILHMWGCRLIAFGLTCVGSDSVHGAYRALMASFLCSLHTHLHSSARR